MAASQPSLAFAPSGSIEADMLRALAAVAPGQDEIAAAGTIVEPVRAEFLRWFLLEAIPRAQHPVARFQLYNAQITGSLNLRAANIGVLLRFNNCTFEEGIVLTDATVVGVDFVGGEVKDIHGDRLTANGSLRLLARKFVTKQRGLSLEPDPGRGTEIGQLRLCGAKIRGNLDLRASRVGSGSSGKKVYRPLFADGLTVDGNVMLSQGFRGNGEICLNGSVMARNLDCSAATLINHNGYSLSAAGATIKGHVLLCRPSWRTKGKGDAGAGEQGNFISEGTVRLDGAKVTGDLNCANGRFMATAFATQGWHPDISKTNADQDDIDQQNEPTYAIKADGISVGADVIFGSDHDISAGYDISGSVTMINGQIGGDLNCSNTKFNFPGEETFCADGVTVKGKTFLDQIYSNGVLRFVQATLTQGFSVSGAKFDVRQIALRWLINDEDLKADFGGPACGVFASFATIGGTFTWQEIGKISDEDSTNNLTTFWLDLFGASGSTVEDDEASWTAIDRFDVTSASYTSLSGLTGAQAAWRLEVLDSQYAFLNARGLPDLKVTWQRLGHGGATTTETAEPELNMPKSFTSAEERRTFFVDYDRRCVAARNARARTLQEAVRRFKPQPYLQLARTFRAAGYLVAARTVMVRLERNQTRYSDFGAIRIVWRWLLDLLLRYGHAALQPIAILMVWALVSAFCFEFAYQSGQIVSLKGGVSAPTQTTPAAHPQPQPTPPLQKINGAKTPPPAFNSLIYAVDTLIPIVDLNQKKNWTVDPLSKAGVHQRPNPNISWVDGALWVWRQLPDWFAPVLLVFNTFFGWLMTTLFVAGVTGLMRADRDI